MFAASARRSASGLAVECRPYSHNGQCEKSGGKPPHSEGTAPLLPWYQGLNKCEQSRNLVAGHMEYGKLQFTVCAELLEGCGPCHLRHFARRIGDVEQNRIIAPHKRVLPTEECASAEKDCDFPQPLVS